MGLYIAKTQCKYLNFNDDDELEIFDKNEDLLQKIANKYNL
jgi:hypothetical protein